MADRNSMVTNVTITFRAGRSPTFQDPGTPLFGLAGTRGFASLIWTRTRDSYVDSRVPGYPFTALITIQTHRCVMKFDPNFVIPETRVNQVRKDSACMLGGSDRLFLTACLVPMWRPLTTFGREYWQRGHVVRGRVNAQAFSLFNTLGCNWSFFIHQWHMVYWSYYNLDLSVPAAPHLLHGLWMDWDQTRQLHQSTSHCFLISTVTLTPDCCSRAGSRC